MAVDIRAGLYWVFLRVFSVVLFISFHFSPFLFDVKYCLHVCIQGQILKKTQTFSYSNDVTVYETSRALR